MRFRVKDILLFNVAFAIIMAACFIAYQNSSIAPDDIALTSTFLFTVSLTLVLGIMYWETRIVRSRLISIIAQLDAPPPWPLTISSAAAILAISFSIPESSMDTLVWILSGTLLGSVFNSMAYPIVWVLDHEINRYTIFTPWNKLYVARDDDGAIHHLQTSKYWWSPAIAVPPELREQIQQLIPKDINEAVP